jgi:lipid A 4'-phosphatase
MDYLSRGRSKAILASFMGLSLLFIALPEVDLLVSGLFYDGGFPLAGQRWNQWLHIGLGRSLGALMAALLALYGFNRLTRKNLLGIDGKAVLYVFLVLILGAGLIVNVLFKDQFGRARPREVQEFGGSSQFTRAFEISNQCDDNCSFSSGETAGAFLALALARVLSRRRSALLIAVALGTAVSLGRIAAGAHFLSDVVVSFFVMLIVSDLLHHLMALREPGGGHAAQAEAPSAAG